jgi:hypothetical protein
MDRKEYILQIAKRFFHRWAEPTAGDKRFGRAILLSFGLFIVSFCVFLLSGFAPFSVWLMYGALYLMVALECIAIVWCIWDIVE